MSADKEKALRWNKSTLNFWNFHMTRLLAMNKRLWKCHQRFLINWKIFWIWWNNEYPETNDFAVRFCFVRYLRFHESCKWNFSTNVLCSSFTNWVDRERGKKRRRGRDQIYLNAFPLSCRICTFSVEHNWKLSKVPEFCDLFFTEQNNSSSVVV